MSTMWHAERVTVELVAQFGATRASHRWKDMPGNWDKLNTRAMFASDNHWGIPTLPKAEVVPVKLIPYNDRYATNNPASNSAIHFFLDDYRFETVWTKPERGISRCQRTGAALTPDFSLWTDMPLVMQLWQVYRSRWCGAWLEHHGIKVIPTIGWSTADSFDFCFAGVSKGSVVAVSTVGIMRDRQAQELFSQGFKEMLAQLEPSKVLIYGCRPQNLADDDRFIYYPTRWEGR